MIRFISNLLVVESDFLFLREVGSFPFFDPLPFLFLRSHDDQRADFSK